MKSLVLSGGGSKGAYEAGFLYEIFDKIEFDNLYGTSVGSLNCLLLAQCYIDNSPDLLKRTWTKEIKKNKHIFKKNYFKIIFGWGTPPFNFSPLRNLLKRILNFEEIMKLDKKIKMTSVDLITGKSVFFSNHEVENVEILLNSVIASASIPPAFLPVIIGDKILVDGGIRDNVPASLLTQEIEENNDSALVILCGPKEIDKKKKEYRGIIGVGIRVIDIMSHEITLNDINIILKINDLLKSTPIEKRNEWLSNKKIIDIEVIEPEEYLGDVLDFNHENLLRIFNMGVKKGREYIKEKGLS